MPTGGYSPYSRVSARRNCDDAIDRLGRRRRAQPKPDFPRPLRIRPRTTSYIAEEQQQGTATRDVCGISPAWSPPRGGLAPWYGASVRDVHGIPEAGGRIRRWQAT